MAERDSETQELIDDRGRRLDSLEASRHRMSGLSFAIVAVVIIFSVGAGLIALVDIQQEGAASSDDIVKLGLAALGLIGTASGHMGEPRGPKS